AQCDGDGGVGEWVRDGVAVWCGPSDGVEFESGCGGDDAESCCCRCWRGWEGGFVHAGRHASHRRHLWVLRVVRKTYRPPPIRRRRAGTRTTVVVVFVQSLGRAKNAIATMWSAAATTVRRWNTSWYPNTRGHGSGRFRAYTTAPAVYATPPARTSVK